MDTQPITDEYDNEPKCGQCNGAGWWVPFMLREDCLKCERTGVDLVASGYKDSYDEAPKADPDDRDEPYFVD